MTDQEFLRELLEVLNTNIDIDWDNYDIPASQEFDNIYDMVLRQLNKDTDK